MLETEFIHYGIIALAVGINSGGVGIGEGLASKAALDASNRQPNAHNEIVQTAILGMALIETAAIMGVLISIVLLFGSIPETRTFYSSISEIGIGLSVCLPGFVLGLVSAWPTQAACNAIARQPFFNQQIFRFMVMTQALIQTPIVFGLLVALFIKDQAPNATTLYDSFRLIASGLCIGLGSIGPAIGLATFAHAAITGLGNNRKSYNKLLSFTLISEAIIETPIIFALVISVTLLFIVPPTNTESLIDAIAFLSAGLCMGLGTIGPGISSGKTAAAACTEIARNPESHSVLSRISMFAQGLIDTCAIYSLLISFLLIFYR